jgi:AcrR family transcriptional regulator
MEALVEAHALRADARANRARIIEAAHAVLRERGIEAEIKEIAERAGVGVGTFYRNFPTKDDLIAAIANEMFQSIMRTLDVALAIDDPVDALRQMLRGAMENVERYGDLAQILHTSMPRQTKEKFDFDALFGRVVAIVQKGIDRGIYRADLDVELAGTLLLGTLQATIMRQLRDTRSLDALAEGYGDLFLCGVRVDATAGG